MAAYFNDLKDEESFERRTGKLSARFLATLNNNQMKSSLRKHPFLLALRRWGRSARRNVCDSAAEIRYRCGKSISGSHGVPNITLSNFACLLVDFGEVLCSSANELQQNSNASSREDYIPKILTVLLEILRVYI